MLTLIQFVCSDIIAAVYEPLINKHPSLAFYFVVSIVRTNLILGLIVSTAIDLATEDQNYLSEMEERAADPPFMN